ncbi:MAG: hypothetical protein JSV81_04850 [Anaerolineales bacterium]|nr:MAG: hypothetical protein JSV81_04850 [Anaerolineales bacterium]
MSTKILTGITRDVPESLVAKYDITVIPLCIARVTEANLTKLNDPV